MNENNKGKETIPEFASPRERILCRKLRNDSLFFYLLHLPTKRRWLKTSKLINNYCAFCVNNKHVLRETPCINQLFDNSSNMCVLKDVVFTIRSVGGMRMLKTDYNKGRAEGSCFFLRIKTELPCAKINLCSIRNEANLRGSFVSTSAIIYFLGFATVILFRVINRLRNVIVRSNLLFKTLYYAIPKASSSEINWNKSQRLG